MTIKFSESTRNIILELLRAGASRQRAARVAGVDRITLYRWLKRGERAHPESWYRAFRDDVRESEAMPRLIALKAEAVRRENNADAALRGLEARGEFRLPPEPDIVRSLLNGD